MTARVVSVQLTQDWTWAVIPDAEPGRCIPTYSSHAAHQIARDLANGTPVGSFLTLPTPAHLRRRTA